MPSNDDLYQDEHRHIRTYNGNRFYLFSNDTSAIQLTDITRALSHTSRFSGMTSRFYSVAEHSILVGHLVALRTGNPNTVLQALMHDAPEAYLTDIPSPFKGALQNYRDLEDGVWKRIATKYNLAVGMAPLVKTMDWVALFAEAMELQPMSEVRTWTNFDIYGQTAVDQLQHGEGIPRLTHEQAASKLYTLIRRFLLKCDYKGDMR